MYMPDPVRRSWQNAASVYVNQRPSAPFLQPPPVFESPRNKPTQGPVVSEFAHYGASHSASILAELPAPLPPAPPTSTSQQQLLDDELLARKLLDMDLAETRRRSNSAASDRLRPVSNATLVSNEDGTILHQQTTTSLRTHSTSSTPLWEPWSPGSFGPPPKLPTPILASGAISSSLPEVIVASETDTGQYLPIPVQEAVSDSNLPLAPVDGISLSAYLEEHRQTPYPPQWSLPSAIITFYGDSRRKGPKANWLDTPERPAWRTTRRTAIDKHPIPDYYFNIKTRSGAFRDTRISWTLTCADTIGDEAAIQRQTKKAKQPKWTYELRLDRNTGIRKNETLTYGSSSVLTTYVHAANYDVLRFVGPEGRQFMWVSSGTVSSVGGARFDTIRHALFGATANHTDPLYGEIVADHTFWDGYADLAEIHSGTRCTGCGISPIVGLRWTCKTCVEHDCCDECRLHDSSGSVKPTCNLSLVALPDEALYIRSAIVDRALIIATLEILKEWERHTLRMEKTKFPKDFEVAEEYARTYDLGVMSYWHAGDAQRLSTVKNGTRIKAYEIDARPSESAMAVGKIIESGFASTRDGEGYAGGDGGGGDGGGG